MTYEEAKIQIQAIPEKIWDQLSEPDREAMEMAFSALQAQEAKTQLSAEGTTSDLISRQDAIDRINKQREHLQPDIYPLDKIGDSAYRICAEFIERLPSAQPEPISEAYAKAVFTWLLDYQIKAAELKGRYTPYEVLSWVANDWRKEHERSD